MGELGEAKCLAAPARRRIAATARATGRAVVTLDRRGFEGLPRVRLA